MTNFGDMDFWNNSTAIDSKSVKILVIPNITNLKNLEKDSYIDVIYNHITSLNNIGNYFFHLILPKPVSKLNLPNVKTHLVDISGNILSMRVLFPKEIIKLLQNLEYDMVYSHMPDWFQVARFSKTPIIGYSHWFEMRSCNAEDRLSRMRNFLISLISVDRMEVCFLNTQEQKDIILEEAKETFNIEFLERLDKKLKVWNLGVPKNKIIDPAVTDKENIIVFNHRCIANKNFSSFVKLIKEYRERRTDFKVWLPQLKGIPPENWMDNTKLPKDEYYKKLQVCKVGVQMRQTHYGWSVAATDCMMNGTPMIFQTSACYEEIDPTAQFFKYKKDFFNMLDKMLDDDEYRIEYEKRAIERSKILSSNDERMIDLLHNYFTNGV
jgi:hypothetical protein